MKLRRCGTLLGFGLGLAVLVPAGRAQAADPGASSDASAQTEQVLMKLHHSNQMEVAAGKLAQEKGQSKDIKSFGKTLVTDHSAADKKVMALAKEEKITLPAAAPMPEDKMNKMKAASGADFDKMFAAEMLEDHKKDIADAKTARDSTQDAKLKALLASTIPVLEKHRDIAQRLTDKLGPSASAAGSNAATTPAK
jgi:putative membrane protein